MSPTCACSRSDGDVTNDGDDDDDGEEVDDSVIVSLSSLLFGVVSNEMFGDGSANVDTLLEEEARSESKQSYCDGAMSSVSGVRNVTFLATGNIGLAKSL